MLTAPPSARQTGLSTTTTALLYYMPSRRRRWRRPIRWLAASSRLASCDYRPWFLVSSNTRSRHVVELTTLVAYPLFTPSLDRRRTSCVARITVLGTDPG